HKRGRSPTATRWLRRVYEWLSHGPLTFLFTRHLWSTYHGAFVRRLRMYFVNRPTDIAISFLPPANTPTLLAAKGTTVRTIPTNHNVPQEDFASAARWDPSPYDRRLRLDSLRYAAAVH